MVLDESTDPENTAPARCGNFFPLFWLFIPQLLAFAFCMNVPWSTEISTMRQLGAGTCFLFIAALACVLERFFSDSEKAKIFSGIWKIAFPVAAFFLFCAWWHFRVPPLENWTEKSPREAEMVLRVEKSFSASEKNFNGIACCEEISGEGCAVLMGRRVWFSLPKKLFARGADAPAEGAQLRAFGVLSGLSPNNFSDKGFLDFLKRERVSAMFSRADSVETLSTGEGAFTRWCGKTRTSLREKLLAISDGNAMFARAGRMLGAMLLGDRTLLLPEQRQNFQLTGTIHIFAVSGLHVSILAAGVLFVLRIFRLAHVPAWLTMLAALWFYVQVIGAPPSAMRAWLMLVFLFLGTLFGRGRMAFHGLVFSACVALFFNPMLLSNIGFRLSYCVVAAILLYGVPAAEIAERAVDIRRWIPESALSFPQKKLSEILRVMISGACISTSAFLAGTPIIVGTFGFCSFSSLVANVVLIPLVSVAAWLGAGALLLACVPVVGVFLGKILFAVAAFPLAAVDFGTELFSKVSGVVELSFPSEGFGAFGALLMLVLFFFGETATALRSRPWLRFSLPPLALCLFLLLCAY